MMDRNDCEKTLKDTEELFDLIGKGRKATIEVKPESRVVFANYITNHKSWKTASFGWVNQERRLQVHRYEGGFMFKQT
jgi:hypothetical protein